MSDPSNVHAIARARERYGLSLDVDDIKKMVATIERGDSVRLRVEPNKRYEAHWLRFRDRLMVVSYEPAVKRITSFLPPDSVKAGSFARHRAKRKSSGWKRSAHRAWIRAQAP